MDIKGMLSSEPSDDQRKQLQRPDPPQPRLSINNLVNDDNTDNGFTAPFPQQQQRPTPTPSGGSNPSSNTEIRARNSIINITNDDDVDIRGNVTPSVARRYSSSESGSPMVTKLDSMSILSGATAVASAAPVSGRSIKDEIESLNRIEEMRAKAKKPTRHRKKPIWSCDWIPTMKRKGGMSSGGGSGSRSGGGGVRVGIGASSRLETVSITGVEPSHDLEYAVASWIYAILSEIPEQEQQFLEIELKFGQIYSKEQDERLSLPVNTEAVLNLDFFHKNCFFKPGIPAERCDTVKRFLELNNKKTNNRFKFVIEKSNHRDNFFQSHDRGNKPINARVSYDIETNRLVDSINKKRVSDLFIYSPATHFDLRCSISLEIPFKLTEEEERKLGKNITLIREKQRTSYTHPQTFTRIDVTQIKSFDKNHGSARKAPPTEAHELELELDAAELWLGFRNLGADSQYYYDLVKTFLSNGRVLNKELS